MSGSEAADANSLTGVWDGLYRQPGRKRHVPFTATLIDSGNLITGATHEPCNLPDCPIKTHHAMLSGERTGLAVAFVKSYEPPGFGYGVVHYSGMLSADGMEIAGSWRILSSALSGEFLMIRAQRKSIAQTEQTERSVSE